MVKDGQAKYLGRGQYVLPDSLQNNAISLTNGKGDVSLSGRKVRLIAEAWSEPDRSEEPVSPLP